MDFTNCRAAPRYDYIKNKNMINNTNQTTGPFNVNTPSPIDGLIEQMRCNRERAEFISSHPPLEYDKDKNEFVLNLI